MKHATSAGNIPGSATLPSGNVKEANQEIGDPGKEIGSPRFGWRSRGHLPHFDSAVAIQHVTFHLADSLPKHALERLEDEIRSLPPEKQDVERRKRVDAWIDAGHGSCILKESVIAEMVQNAFLFFEGQRYRLLAWVVMPNHVHVLFHPLNGWSVAKIVASWKKFTARRIGDYYKNTNQEIGDSRIWHREYWDRFIRNERHFQQAMEYIHLNPVKARLVARAEDWPWSSVSTAGQNANQEIGGPGKNDDMSFWTNPGNATLLSGNKNANREIGDPEKR